MARLGAVGAPGALLARSAARPTSTGPTPALVPAGVRGKPLPPALRRTAALISRAFSLQHGSRRLTIALRSDHAPIIFRFTPYERTRIARLHTRRTHTSPRRPRVSRSSCPGLLHAARRRIAYFHQAAWCVLPVLRRRRWVGSEKIRRRTRLARSFGALRIPPPVS